MCITTMIFASDFGSNKGTPVDLLDLTCTLFQGEGAFFEFIKCSLKAL